MAGGVAEKLGELGAADGAVTENRAVGVGVHVSYGFDVEEHQFF